MTAVVSNLKRLSSSAVRFTAAEGENEDDDEAMRGSKARNPVRERAPSISNKSYRIRFSQDSQRCILPVRSQNSIKMKDLHELGAVGTLVGSSAASQRVNAAEDADSLNDFFRSCFTKQEIRVAVLGAAGVGKTSIVQQFVANRFSSTYCATYSRRIYHPVMLTSSHLFDIKLYDCPPMEHFYPTAASNHRFEWTKYIGAGLHSASVYVLVYDVNSEQSFDLITQLRDELMAHFDSVQRDSSPLAPDMPARHVPIVVVGNKRDLHCSAKADCSRTARLKLSNCASLENGENNGLSAMDLTLDDLELARSRTGTARERTLNRKSTYNRSITSIRMPVDSQKRCRSRSRLLKKLSSTSNPSSAGDGFAAVVTRNWKAVHLECSAKYNWNVGRIFEEIVKLVEEEKGEMSRKNSRKGTVIRHNYNKCTVS